jgi:hypothetical protein
VLPQNDRRNCLRVVSKYQQKALDFVRNCAHIIPTCQRLDLMCLRQEIQGRVIRAENQIPASYAGQPWPFGEEKT